jgi:FKBP-type peptidyl-prolyl cis-trans isomerase SlyD
MKKFQFASVLVLLCVCSSVFAQETKADRAIRAVKELCLTGTQFDLKVDAKGNLTLRKLLPGGEGAVSVNVRESSGAAAIFDEKIRQIADEDIRRCIQPYIKQIIDAILSENLQSNPQMIQYTGRVRDKDTNLPIQDAKISLEVQGVPLIEHTDSEGIYRFTVKPVNHAVRMRVEAKGYEVYLRLITLSSDNISLEDIPLVRLRSGSVSEPIPPRISSEKEVPASQAKDTKLTVSEGKRVSVEYTLTLDDKSVVESNVGGEPLIYWHGSHQLIPSLEKALEGMKAGDTKQVTVAPAEGYGERDPKAREEVQKQLIPPDALKVGTRLQGKSPSGRTGYPRVAEIKDKTVVLDFNHPLAGKTLHFKVKILDIKEEKQEKSPKQN